MRPAATPRPWHPLTPECTPESCTHPQTCRCGRPILWVADEWEWMHEDGSTPCRLYALPRTEP